MNYPEEELERLQLQFEAGHFPALIEAIVLCGNDTPLPAWAVAAARSALEGLYFGAGKGTGRQGRSNGLRSRAEQELVHERRWDIADWALRIRRDLPAWGYPATREGAFELASEMLRGTPAQGTAAAVKASHLRQQRKRVKN